MRALAALAAWTLLIASALGPRSAPAFLEDYRKGPQLAVQFPHVYDLGFEARHRTTGFSMGLGFGYVPQLSFGGAYEIAVGVSHVEARARWHPFAGAFFVGAALGSRVVSARGRATIDVNGTNVPVRVDLELKSPYLNPHIGWMWVFDRGLTLGAELGSQRGSSGAANLGLVIEDPSISKSVEEIQATAGYQALESRLESEFAKLGKVTLPYVALRVGWMF